MAIVVVVERSELVMVLLLPADAAMRHPARVAALADAC